MSTLLLFILFAFLALAMWLGYTAYRSMQKKRGPVPPGGEQEGARPAGEVQTNRAQQEGATPVRSERARPAGETAPVRPEDDAGPKRPKTGSGPGRPESDAGPNRPASSNSSPASSKRRNESERR